MLERLYSWVQTVDLPIYCCKKKCREEKNKTICDVCCRVYYIPAPNKNKK